MMHYSKEGILRPTMSPLKLKMLTGIFVLLFAIIASSLIIFDRRYPLFGKLVAVFALLGALFMITQRDTHLPFLGMTALPPFLLKPDFAPAGANIEAKVRMDGKDGNRIIYWGAKPSKATVPNPWDAYGDYTNAGIATVKNGEVVLRFYCPSKYTVPYGKTLDRHIHFRRCCDITGMLGRVETMNVDC